MSSETGSGSTAHLVAPAVANRPNPLVGRFERPALFHFPLPSTAWLPEPSEVETRQCLSLHVAAALTGKRSLAGVRTSALVVRKEMLHESVEAFAHRGAPPHVSEAEAFVRHNAHDCFYPPS